MEKIWIVTDFIFGCSKITADGDCSHEIKRCLLLGRKAVTNLDSILKCRDITLPTKVRLVKAMVFLGVVYGCENLTLKIAEDQRRCFWTMVLKKTLESPLDCKEIQPVHPEGCQSWTFIGRTDADAETSNFWPPMQSTDSLEKYTDPGVDWRPKGKGMTEDEMVRWHHQINRHEFA